MTPRTRVALGLLFVAARVVTASVVSASVAMVAVPPSAAAQRGPTAILNRVRVNARRQIDFHAAVLSDSVFVGQQVTYQVAVLLSAEARSRLRRNPEFLPPELRGLLAYELGTPTRVGPKGYDGAVFEAHVFQRALFPVASGVQVVPGPQLTYALPQSASYFSREERFVVRAESASFVVKPLPLDGRPDDFGGAVGQFTSTVRLDSAVARVGDPLILTLRVQGTGNVKLLPRPVLELNWASVVAGSERIQVDSSGALVRGAKEFDWILTPARDGRVSVPALRYSYFDPYAARYAVAQSAPLELAVRAGTLAAAAEGEDMEVLPLRAARGLREEAAWTGRSMPPVSWIPWLSMAALAPLLAALLALRARFTAGASRRGSNASDSMTASASAMPAASPREALRDVRRQLLVALAERFGQTPQAILSRVQLTRILRRSGVTRETTRKAVALLDRLDALGFADLDELGTVPSAETARRDADVLLRDIEAEAIPRGRKPRATALLLLLTMLTLPLVVAVQSLGAQPAPDIEQVLESARVAYAQRAYLDATERFGVVARQFPNDPDVLVNWGTAAWAANDTVTAVIAWQRAARLEPLAADVIRRLDALPTGARGGVADVPMVSVPWLLRVGFACWTLGWLSWSWALWRGGRRRGESGAASRTENRFVRPLRVAAAALVVVGSTAGLTAWWGARALDAHRLFVVSRPETLRIAPGNDADAMGGVTTGDVVSVVESRRQWQRVQHADGRRGWLPSARLVAISPTATDPAVE